MGNCIYCGKPAGLFRSKHSECLAAAEKQYAEEMAQRQKIESERSQALTEIRTSAAQALEVDAPLDSVAKAVSFAKNTGVDESTIKKVLIEQWNNAVDKNLDDGVIDENELRRLSEYLKALSIDSAEVDRDGHFSRMVKGVALHELFSGALPQRFGFSGNIPVNLQKNEKIVWGFPDTQYIETRTRIERVGGSQGVSLRIMSGVYYRVGAFKSRPVEKTEHRHLDTGWLILTDRNLYFAGPAKSQRIPYTKIVTIDPYSDGIGIMRDAASAKPQTFITNDGWFTYNLLANLAQR